MDAHFRKDHPKWENPTAIMKHHKRVVNMLSTHYTEEQELGGYLLTLSVEEARAEQASSLAVLELKAIHERQRALI